MLQHDESWKHLRLYEIPKISKLLETENRTVVSGYYELRKGRTGKVNCSIDIEFPFGILKVSGNCSDGGKIYSV